MGSGTHPDLECLQCSRGLGWGGSATAVGQKGSIEGCLEGLCDPGFRMETQKEEEEEGQERGEPVGSLAFLPAKWAWQHVPHKAEKGPLTVHIVVSFKSSCQPSAWSKAS